jgi:hypothetical protein
MFKLYLENYRYITNNMPYRSKLIPHFVKSDGFFRLSSDRHAWILHSHFHVDMGEPGDVRFFPTQETRRPIGLNPNLGTSPFRTTKSEPGA